MQLTGNRQFKLIASFLCFVLAACKLSSQPVALSSAYSHNDYWNKRPFYDAVNNGFTHLEADIFLKGNRLVVAHHLPFFKKRRTLERLYLKPLLKYLESRKGQPQTAMDTLVLVVDIKSDAERTYNALEKKLKPYQHLLSTYSNGIAVQRNLTIVLTGHKPIETIRKQNYRMVFADENLKNMKDNNEGLYTIASCRYSALIKWKGQGKMPFHEKQKLCSLVALAHMNNKKVRLWASPENENVWEELLSCGVDLINTDKIVALRKFFTKTVGLYATNYQSASTAFAH